MEDDPLHYHVVSRRHANRSYRKPVTMHPGNGPAFSGLRLLQHIVSGLR